MKRHTDLIPFSQEHHHTLALCLRILRAPSEDFAQILPDYCEDLLRHFEQEEALFAPYWEKVNRSDLQQRFETEHRVLREWVAQRRFSERQWQTELARLLQQHIRFEERELFTAIQDVF